MLPEGMRNACTSKLVSMNQMTNATASDLIHSHAVCPPDFGSTRTTGFSGVASTCGSSARFVTIPALGYSSTFYPIGNEDVRITLHCSMTVGGKREFRAIG